MLKKLTILFCLLVLAVPAWAQEDTEWTEFTTSDGTLTFSYPADWLVLEEEENSSIKVSIASSEAAVDAINADEVALEAGDFVIGLLFPSDEELAEIAPDLDPASETYHADLVQALGDLFVAGNQPAGATAEPATTPEPFGEPVVVEPSEEFPYTYTQMSADAYSIVAAEGEFAVYGFDNELEGQDFTAMVYEAGDDVVGVALIIASPEDTEDDAANSIKLLQLLESVEYTPPAE